MKTSFLSPILHDTQRWLTYSYYQIKMILSFFPGSNTKSLQLEQKLIEDYPSSINMMIKKLQKFSKQSKTSLNKF